MNKCGISKGIKIKLEVTFKHGVETDIKYGIIDPKTEGSILNTITEVYDSYFTTAIGVRVIDEEQDILRLKRDEIKYISNKVYITIDLWAENGVDITKRFNHLDGYDKNETGLGATLLKRYSEICVVAQTLCIMLDNIPDIPYTVYGRTSNNKIFRRKENDRPKKIKFLVEVECDDGLTEDDIDKTETGILRSVHVRNSSKKIIRV